MLYTWYCRIYQGAFRLVSPLLPWRKPELLEGANSLQQLPPLIKARGTDRVLIVTDKGLASLGLLDGLLDGLQREGIDYAVYDETVPNPTIDNIETALALYHARQCQGLIAFGGGSPMDCAKGVAARVARPEKSIPQLRGVLKVRKAIPPLFAIPTTAGTGSEATVAAVVSNPHTHEKFAINDPVLIPHVAVLDPLLTVKLPPHITATTGMDALTHAIEAYIGQSNTAETRACSREAVQLIFAHLLDAYADGSNLTARTQMQKAAYLAGVAFTRAYVGYVHAIAHTLGGFYGVPHGLANAVILPYVLEYYGECVHQPLAELADVAGITAPADSPVEKARKMIAAIRGLNERMNIPRKIGGIAASDIPLMAERAFHEANPLYPVPRILGKKDLIRLYHRIGE